MKTYLLVSPSKHITKQIEALETIDTKQDPMRTQAVQSSSLRKASRLLAIMKPEVVIRKGSNLGFESKQPEAMNKSEHFS